MRVGGNEIRIHRLIYIILLKAIYNLYNVRVGGNEIRIHRLIYVHYTTEGNIQSIQCEGGRK